MIITDIKKQKKDENRFSVYVDGEYAFSLIAQDIEYFKLKESCEIAEEKYRFILDTIVYIKAQDLALKYLSYKMRTGKEVRDKLEKSDFSEGIIEKVMEFLTKYNYIDDYQYSMAYIRQSLKLNPVGKYAIQQKLRGYGVEQSVIEKALYDSEIDEEKYAREVIGKKTSGKNYNTDSDLRKLQDFLIRRGFSYDIIKTVVDEYKKNLEEQ
ncbi:RecX family transcriptional regulator [Lachnospiraceae bacterium NSJ-143]|nr:RecX family transcriptional regulator [Lachnospiraceae bacterium NSJ-143]